MGANLDITEKLQNYINDFGLNLHPVQKEIIEYNKTLGDIKRMQIDPTQCHFLHLIIKISNIKNVLEIGTFTGLSALSISLALPEDGKLVVLDKNEGALPKMSSMIRKGLGSPLGSGNQYMPWVHIDDAVNAFMNTIENKINHGTYNVVSSQHCNNKEFTTAIGNALNRRIRLPNVPSFVIKFIYGELADILLEGSRVSNEKIKSQGFDFKYDLIEDALSEIYS